MKIEQQRLEKEMKLQAIENVSLLLTLCVPAIFGYFHGFHGARRCAPRGTSPMKIPLPDRSGLGVQRVKDQNEVCLNLVQTQC